MRNARGRAVASARRKPVGMGGDDSMGGLVQLKKLKLPIWKREFPSGAIRNGIWDAIEAARADAIIWAYPSVALTPQLGRGSNSYLRSPTRKVLSAR